MQFQDVSMRRMGRGIRGAFVDNARRPTLAAVFAATAVGLASAADTPGRVRIETVSYDQTTIEVLDQGSGPAVVMIPSLGRGAADFDALAARVAAAGYRVLRPQPRAIGASTGPQSGITLHSLAEDVARVIDFSGEGQAVVLGHAAGNRTARAVAAYYRDKVAAVVLLAAGGKAPPTPQISQALRDSLNLSLSDQIRLPQVGKAFFAPGHDPAVWSGGWYPDAARIETAAGSATAVGDWWTAGAAPVLVVQADEDVIAPPVNAALLAHDIGARATVVHIADAGHAMLPEQPDKIADAVIQYLRALKLRR
jgi:pimeloyl-ACP methyl ester carboxylesterase